MPVAVNPERLARARKPAELIGRETGPLKANSLPFWRNGNSGIKPVLYLAALLQRLRVAEEGRALDSGSHDRKPR